MAGEEPPTPPAPPETGARRRLLMAGGVVIVAALVVVIAIVVSSQSSSTPGKPSSPSTTKTVSRTLAGIPQSGTVLGNPKAPVTILYFGDLECSGCQAFTLEGGLPDLIAHQVRQGTVKVQYHSFCTATCDGPGIGTFETQQVAAYAAGLQDRFWNYAELFYREQGEEGTGYVTPAYLAGLARQIPGLSLSRWQTDRGNPDLLADVEADLHAADQLKLRSTPTVIAEGPTGRAIEVPEGVIPTYAQLEQAIAQVRNS